MNKYLIAFLALYLPLAAESCDISKIEIKSMKVKKADPCRTKSCPHLTGVAVLINKCDTPIGVQLNMTAYDKHGAPVATREMWPASIRNIPQGEFTFSLEQWLDYEPDMHSFTLAPVSVKKWP